LGELVPICAQMGMPGTARGPAVLLTRLLTRPCGTNGKLAHIQDVAEPDHVLTCSDDDPQPAEDEAR